MNSKFKVPFILETGASNIGLGEVLSQEINGKNIVIAYASKSLNKGERNKANYSEKKLELLAVVWPTMTIRLKRVEKFNRISVSLQYQNDNKGNSCKMDDDRLIKIESVDVKC